MHNVLHFWQEYCWNPYIVLDLLHFENGVATFNHDKSQDLSNVVQTLSMKLGTDGIRKHKWQTDSIMECFANINTDIDSGAMAYSLLS